MARGTRLDAPGALHHVMQRGIERSIIFRDPADYKRFLGYAASIFTDTQTRCLAWSLMPNHVHLLLLSGATPLSRVLQRLFTSYAVSYNVRWRRNGHLFQGRYKSLLCETEPYLLDLVRYIHINPVRAGVCASLAELTKYPWTGHRSLMGMADLPWQETGMVLDGFGGRRTEARERYEAFCREGLKQAPDRRLAGEGLRHLEAGGWESLAIPRGAGREWADERVLGSEEFIDQALKAAGEQERWRSRAKRHGVSLERILGVAAKKAGIGLKEITGSGKRPEQVRARALACHWLVVRLGYPGVIVARRLGITEAAVSKSARRGGQMGDGARARLPATEER